MNFRDIGSPFPSPFRGTADDLRPRSQVRNGTDWRNNIIEMRLINIAKRDLSRPCCQATGLAAAVPDPSTDEPLALLSFLYAALQMHLRPNHEIPARRVRRPIVADPPAVSMIFALLSTLLRRETAYLCNDIRRK